MANSHDNGASCYFKAGTVNPLTKATSTIKNAIAHNRRTTQAAHGSRSNIDASRTRLNYCLAGIDNPSEIVQRVTAGMVEHKARKNAPHAVEVLISLPDNWNGDTRAVFVDSIPYLTGILGADNLLTADVHLDEPNPHMHVLFMPLEHCKKKGRLVWRSTVGGRGRELYDGFFSEVGAKHGLDRPVNLTANMRAALAMAVIDTMNRSGDGAINGRAWEAVKMAIKANPKPFAVQLGINLKTFTECQNPLGTFGVIKNPLGSFEAKAKTPTLCRSFESTVLPDDLKTGELKAERSVFESHKTMTKTANNLKVSARVSASNQDSGMVETVRVRESENDPAYFNPETGEFMKPQQTTRLNRAAADSWVAGALNQHN
jgi:Plasmid recombination enzyme